MLLLHLASVSSFDFSLYFFSNNQINTDSVKNRQKREIHLAGKLSNSSIRVAKFLSKFEAVNGPGSRGPFVFTLGVCHLDMNWNLSLSDSVIVAGVLTWWPHFQRKRKRKRRCGDLKTRARIL